MPPIPMTSQNPPPDSRGSMSLNLVALSPLVLTFLLLTVLILPTVPLYLGAATSMALGTTMAAAVIVFVCWFHGAVRTHNALGYTLNFFVVPGVVVFFTTVVILAHSIVADAILSADITRTVASFIPLAFLLFGAIFFGRALLASSDKAINLAIRFSFWILCLVIVLQWTDIQPRAYAFPKSMFPFTETSHFALAYTPILMYLCVRAKRSRSLWWLSAAFALALLLQSLSLLIGCILIAAVCRRLFLVSICAAVILIALAAGLPLGLEYFGSRLDFSGSAINLSNLVYVQGWELIPESLSRSFGWGVGFQQLGFHGTNAPASVLIHTITDGEDANLTDGSFVFSKLASEFGIAGFVLALLYLIGASRCIRALRKGGEGAPMCFARCIVVAYGGDMFVRGTGYFVESTFLFLAATSALFSGSIMSIFFRETKAILRRGIAVQQP
jgi:hypothetical protein